jgi:hypothetical protein
MKDQLRNIPTKQFALNISLVARKDQSNRKNFDNLLTSIFTLVDIAKMDIS